MNTKMLEKSFIDLMDVNFDISLHEYGIIRNPKTGIVVLCITDTDQKVKYDYTRLSLSDVIDLLEEVTNDFYNYIGEDKKDVLKNLDNNNLSGIIFSIKQYSGLNESFYYNYTLNQIIDIIDSID